MVKTMLAALFLGAISVGAAQPVVYQTLPPFAQTITMTFTNTPLVAPAREAQCAVDGVSAVNDMSDAAMFIWAASKRCGNPADSQVKCEIDIASAAQSASNMIATIAGAVAECGAVHANADCAVAVSGLTGAAAGLAAASGGILKACPNSLNHVVHNMGTGQATTLGKCIFDAKATMKSLFGASKQMSQAADVHGSKNKANAAVNVLAALAGMGSTLAASFNDCSSVNGAGNAKADCASAVLGLVSSLNGVAQAGKQIKQGCNAGAARLYLEDEKNEEVATSSPSLPLAFAALLPMAAVFSFAAGRYTRTSYRSMVRSDEEAATLVIE